MTCPPGWREAESPAVLFLALWERVNALPRSQLAQCVPPPEDVRKRLGAMLALGESDEAVQGLCDIIDGAWPKGERFPAERKRNGLMLAVMQAIDMALYAVHPRAVSPPARLAPWLADMREQRTLNHIYGASGALTLIARGPLIRTPRSPGEEQSFVLIDQFAALKVVKLGAFEEDGRKIEIALRVIDQSADRGVPPRRERRGSEVVSFVPLAEAHDDLAPKISEEEERFFLDVRKGESFAPAAILAAACGECADSDILLAPELTVAEDDISELSSALFGADGARPRLIVAGSGLTSAAEAGSGLPYNEAVILNGAGTALWTHRKVAAYHMDAETACDLELVDAASQEKLFERIAWSDAVTIADVDGLGRCLVLICQDLKMDLVQSLLREFCPDWVIVPILDTGTSLVRWPANRARDLAAFGETRFVVVSSLTMKCWSKQTYPGEEMGVAIGPVRVNKGDAALDKPSIETDVAPESKTRRHGTIRWRGAKGWTSYREPRH